MPASTADRRILVFSTVVVVVAGVALALALFFATGGGGGTPEARPLFVGLEKQLLENIKEDGPQYIANPFAGHGFWLDVEGNEVVAYSLVLPGTEDCTVKWKAQQDTYVDCNREPVDRAALDQYEVSTRPGEGKSREVLVDLRVLEPASGSADGGG